MNFASITWKKYKSSSTFARRVKKNIRKITNPISPFLAQNLQKQKDSKQQSVNVECNNINTNLCLQTDESTPATHDHEDTIRGNNEENIYREQWLQELENEEDEELEITSTANEEIEDKNEEFRKDLQIWAINFGINHHALKGIMHILNKRWKNILPQDPRTLLLTPTTVIIQKMGNGFYWHNGLEICLRSCYNIIKNLSCISLNVNIDGLPIYRSSKDEFWPILFNIHELPHIRPMVIGIYYGKGKPSSLEAFITPFVEEAKPILERGIEFDNGNRLKIGVRCFICDSPARAFVKGVANFNEQHGCLKCTTIGEYSYISHCNIFPQINCPPRTDQGFRLKQYGAHHKCYSPLEQLPGIDMIKDFPVADALHLLDLGIMKRCLLGWRDGTFRNYRMKWSANDTLNISRFLQNCKMPSEIHRAVRGLDCLSHWKGLEFRTFFYYIGIVAIKDYLSSDVYQHFLLLFCAITICSSNFYSEYIDLADKMLQHYVSSFKEIYGEQYMTSNVHNISHLTDDVRNFGVLSTFSSYPFESKLCQIKTMLRHGGNPLAQVAKRIIEASVVSEKINMRNDNIAFPILEKPNDGVEIDYKSLMKTNVKPDFFYKIKLKNFTLSNEMKNKWFLTNNKEIVCVKNILLNENNIIHIYGASLKEKYSYFELPIRSSHLNIFSSNCLENRPKLYTLDDIMCKLVAVVYNAETVVFLPLLHTL